VETCREREELKILTSSLEMRRLLRHLDLVGNIQGYELLSQS
jgi:hypothetical protein